MIKSELGIVHRKNLKEKYSDKFLLRLVSSYSFLLVIILILGMLMYYYGINSAKKDLLKENQVDLERAISDVDGSFRMMPSLNAQIANDTDIVKLMQNNTVNYQYFLQARDAKKSLLNLLSIQNMTFFEDVFLYFYETDYILSANEFESSLLYYQFNKRYNKEYYTDYIKMLTNEENFGKPQNLSKYSDTRDDFLLYTYPMSIYRNYSKAPVTICYRIDKSYFEKLFSGLNIYENGFIYVKNAGGQEILRLMAPSSLTLTTEELDEKIEANKNSGYLVLNHERMVVTKAVSNNNSWTYYLVQPSAMVFQNLVFIQRIYWAAIILVLLLGLALLVLLSGKNLAPIKQIEFRLKNSLAEEESIKIQGYDVMHSIDRYVNLLIDKKATLQETIEHQRPIIFSAYLARLMKGLVDTAKETDQIAGALNLDKKNSRFIILYLGVYLNELEFYIDDYMQNKNSFQEVIKEVLCKSFDDKILIYEADFQSYAILIKQEETENNDSCLADLGEMAKERFLMAYEELRNQFSLIIYGGISEEYNELMYTWQACQHAAQALRNAGPEHIFQRYSEMKKDYNQYFYPIEMEEQLISFITNGKQNQVGILLKNIFKENFTDRSLSITMSKWFLSDLRNTLLKIRFMLPEDVDSMKKDALDEKFGLKKSFELIETIALDLCAIYESRLKNHSIIEKVQQYVEENYQDSSLSLSKISQEFDISECYFSSLFKKVTNQNFSEYLEKIRLRKALNLLQTTRYNINEIAELVGYTNTVSFRRAFKRMCGINPAAVRGGNTLSKEEKVEEVPVKELPLAENFSVGNLEIR